MAPAFPVTDGCEAQEYDKTMGICYGLCAGVVIGVLTGHLGIFIPFGMLFGIMVEGAMNARKLDKPAENRPRQ
jgi:hypothetical protein